MNLFKKNHYSADKLKEGFTSKLEIIIKSFILLLTPIPFTLVVSFIWYYAFYRNDIFFNQMLEEIITTAWIPIFGILYGLLAAIILSTVWNEYKAMRTAVKKYDFET